MAIYRCRFFGESGEPPVDEYIEAARDIEARATAHGMYVKREAASGFELWAGKRSVDTYGGTGRPGSASALACLTYEHGDGFASIGSLGMTFAPLLGWRSFR